MAHYKSSSSSSTPKATDSTHYASAATDYSEHTSEQNAFFAQMNVVLSTGAIQEMLWGQERRTREGNVEPGRVQLITVCNNL